MYCSVAYFDLPYYFSLQTVHMLDTISTKIWQFQQKLLFVYCTHSHDIVDTLCNYINMHFVVFLYKQTFTHSLCMLAFSQCWCQSVVHWKIPLLKESAPQPIYPAPLCIVHEVFQLQTIRLAQLGCKSTLFIMSAESNCACLRNVQTLRHCIVDMFVLFERGI